MSSPQHESSSLLLGEESQLSDVQPLIVAVEEASGHGNPSLYSSEIEKDDPEQLQEEEEEEEDHARIAEEDEDEDHTERQDNPRNDPHNPTDHNTHTNIAESIHPLDLENIKKSQPISRRKHPSLLDACGNPLDKRKAAAMTLARGIVQRYRERGCVLPKEWIQRKGNPEREQEYKDKNKLRKWRQALDGNYKGNICFHEIKVYLDANMPDWSQGRQARHKPSLDTAQGIVERFYARGSVLPRVGESGSAAQETYDAECLIKWRQLCQRQLRRKLRDTTNTQSEPTAPDALEQVRELLDQHLPRWREPDVQYGELRGSSLGKSPNSHRSNVDPMIKAAEIVKRYKERGNVLPKEWNDVKGNPERLQEYKDASKLRKWRQALNGVKSVSTVCPDFLQEYLDEELVNWRYSVKNKGGGEGSRPARESRKRMRAEREDEVNPNLPNSNHNHSTPSPNHPHHSHHTHHDNHNITTISHISHHHSHHHGHHGGGGGGSEDGSYQESARGLSAQESESVRHVLLPSELADSPLPHSQEDQDPQEEGDEEDDAERYEMVALVRDINDEDHLMSLDSGLSDKSPLHQRRRGDAYNITDTVQI